MALGGTLDLTFAPGVDVATQLGRTVDLFDWSGVAPTGAFSVTSPFMWDLSQLYTTGEVTLTAAPGLAPSDFNGDGVVDAADLAQWTAAFGITGAAQAQGDADGDADVDGADFLTWQRQLGGAPPLPPVGAAVPEPNSLLLLALAFGPAMATRLLRHMVRP